MKHAEVPRSETHPNVDTYFTIGIPKPDPILNRHRYLHHGAYACCTISQFVFSFLNEISGEIIEKTLIAHSKGHEGKDDIFGRKAKAS